MTQPIVAVAGATGSLGHRIVAALLQRGAQVRALVRRDAEREASEALARLGATVCPADPADVEAMASVCAGAACVVSALNGLRDVVVDRQTVLLDAAVKAGVPRFIPSDYCADFTKTRPGDNRNFDFRREFMRRADRAPLRVTSIFNGAFMDMLGREMPLIQASIRRVLYWNSADQPLDFTMKEDVAAYTAAAALDPAAPRILRIAGDTVTVRDLAKTMTNVTGRRYRPLWAGTTGTLSVLIAVTKALAPGPGAPFPPWQGMQYLRDMFSGRAQLTDLDNRRYPTVGFTSVRAALAARSWR